MKTIRFSNPDDDAVLLSCRALTLEARIMWRLWPNQDPPSKSLNSLWNQSPRTAKPRTLTSQPNLIVLTTTTARLPIPHFMSQNCFGINIPTFASYFLSSLAHFSRSPALARWLSCSTAKFRAIHSRVDLQPGLFRK